MAQLYMTDQLHAIARARLAVEDEADAVGLQPTPSPGAVQRTTASGCPPSGRSPRFQADTAYEGTGPLRVVFDGKERLLRLERATSAGNENQWQQVLSRPAGDPDSAQDLQDVLSQLRAL